MALLFDMQGNAECWCMEAWKADLHMLFIEDQEDGLEVSKTHPRAVRDSFGPWVLSYHYGFRLVRTIAPE